MPSTATALCPTCGTALDANGVCGVCLAGLLDEKSIEFSLPGLDELKELARGGMGIVYRAVETNTGRVVAVKIPATRYWHQAQAVKRFMQEARSAALLEHPHVLPVYEVRQTADTPYFTMKLATGGSLADQLKARDADRSAAFQRWAAEVIAGIAEAVHHAHSLGVLHRDIKPANILFDDAGTAYLSDFGLAKIEEGGALMRSADLLSTVGTVGTAHYLAPEIANGEAASFSASADVYALGGVLYEIFAGVPPHVGETLAQLLRRVADETPRAIAQCCPSLAPDLAAICEKAMMRLPADRYGSAAEMAQDLRRWLNGEPVVARPLPVHTRTLRLAKRHPLVTAAIGLSLAIIVGSSLVLWRSNVKLQAANAKARKLLAESMVSEAREMMLGMTPARGRRAISKLQAAVAMDPTCDVTQEAIQAIALPGLIYERHLNLDNDTGVLPAFATSVSRMVTASVSRVALIDLEKDETLWSHELGPEQRVKQLHCSSHGTLVIIALHDGTCECWSTKQNKLLATLRPQNSKALAIEPQSIRVVWIDDQGTGHADDLLHPGSTKTFAAPGNDVLGMTVDEKRISVVHEKSLDVIDLKTLLRAWSAPLLEASGPVTSDGNLVAVADRRAILVFDAVKGKPVGQLSGHLRMIKALAWMPGTDMLLSTSLDGMQRAWDTRTFESLWSQRLSAVVLTARTDGKRFCTAGVNRTADLWRVNRASVFREFKGSDGDAYDVVLRFNEHLQSQWLATTSTGRVRIWDIANHSLLGTSYLKSDSTGKPSAAFDPDGNGVIMSRPGGVIQRRAIAHDADGKATLSASTILLDKTDSAVVRVTREGNWIVSRDALYIWPQGDRKLEHPLVTDSTDKGLLFDDTFTWLTTARTSTGSIVVRRCDSPATVFSVPVKGVAYARWTPHYLAVIEDERVRLFAIGTWEQKLERPFKGDIVNGGFVGSAQDGRLVAVQQEHDIIEVIDVPASKMLMRLNPPKNLEVQGLIFAPDGEHVYLAGMGQRVYEWDLTRLRDDLQKLGL